MPVLIAPTHRTEAARAICVAVLLCQTASFRLAAGVDSYDLVCDACDALDAFQNTILVRCDPRIDAMFSLAWGRAYLLS